MNADTKGEHGLVRAVGALGLAAGVVNVTIGGGIYRLPREVAESLGPAAPLAFLVCAAVMAMIGLSLAQAGSRVATTGGPYAYVERVADARLHMSIPPSASIEIAAQ